MGSADTFVRLAGGVPEGIRVYVLDLDRAPAAETLLSRLSEGERQRSARLKGARAAERFVARRWGLRVAVAESTGGRPEQVGLEWDGEGRPRLGEGGLCISTSSFGPVALVAMSPRAVGIDLLGPEAEAIAAAAALALPIFADALTLGGTGRADPRRAWTHLEATLKAAGLGFNVPEVKGAVRAEAWSEDGPSVLRVEHPAAARSNWSAHSLAVPTGFVASVVIPCAG